MPITHLPLRDLYPPECNPCGSSSSAFAAESSRRRTLADINVRIAKARRVVVVSGAGISCSSGIPDFRSENGLYALVKERYPDSFVTGKDLFSSGLFANPATTSIFYTFIAELRLACDAAQPTRTHDFIHRLEKKGKLLRSYTQNVDGLERRMGLESGGRGRGYKKNGTRNVELHGDLGRARCVVCYADVEATVEIVEAFREGTPPGCPSCEERYTNRLTRGARQTTIGYLRPSIVLYDEHHPMGDDITDLQMYDMRRRPDVLLVMGTSLKVHGLKRLVKDFAKAVHDAKGVVVFVNTTAPNKEWEDVIDYHIEGETDRWVERMEDEWRRVRPQDWELQETLDSKVVRKSVAKGKGKGKATGKAMGSKAGKGNIKGKGKVLQLEEMFQLPTPPASQDSDPCSSPLSSCPSSPPPSPLPALSETIPTRSCQPTPVSPSKRSPSRSLSAKAHKKSKLDLPDIPSTNNPSKPGRGNLFTLCNIQPCDPSSSTLPSGSETDSDEFLSPVKQGLMPVGNIRLTRSKSVTSTRPTPAANRQVKRVPTRTRRGVGAPDEEILLPSRRGDKENAPPNPAPRLLGTGRGPMRRTASVPAQL